MSLKRKIVLCSASLVLVSLLVSYGCRSPKSASTGEQASGDVLIVRYKLAHLGFETSTGNWVVPAPAMTGQGKVYKGVVKDFEFPLIRSPSIVQDSVAVFALAEPQVIAGRHISEIRLLYDEHGVIFPPIDHQGDVYLIELDEQGQFIGISSGR